MRHAVCYFFLLCPGLLQAQYTNVRVSDPLSTTPEEVTIAIDPTNPLHLAAGANIDVSYRSTNGGLTWIQGNLTSSFGVAGDPCVLFDGLGNLYYAHLSSPSTGYWLDRIVVQKSTDGGVTWNDGVGIGLNPPKQQDKEWLAVDRTSSPYRNNLYVAWTQFDIYASASPQDSSRIMFSRSIDTGKTWSVPVRISDRAGNCLDGDSTVEGAVPAVGPNGEVCLSWAGPLGIMFDKSTDGGVTFGRDVFVTSQPGGWDFNVDGIYRCNGLPVTTCDVSNSLHRGNIYITWSDQRNGPGDTDVFLTKSTDGGKTWGQVKRVNNDNPGSQQFFPWMTIDQSTGNLYFVFYDRRATTGNGTDVYCAKSVDGGDTFENFKVSENSFIPTSSVFFGDYTNIAALNGKVYPIWMRMDNVTLSVWTALVNDGGSSSVDNSPELPRNLTLSQNYPNPFNPGTTIRFSLPSGTRHVVSLVVFNLLGQQVATLVNEEKQGGTYAVRFNATGLPSGIYIYRLRVDGENAVRKMMVLK